MNRSRSGYSVEATFSGQLNVLQVLKPSFGQVAVSDDDRLPTSQGFTSSERHTGGSVPLVDETSGLPLKESPPSRPTSSPPTKTDFKRHALGVSENVLTVVSGASDFIPFGNIVKLVADTGLSIAAALKVCLSDITLVPMLGNSLQDVDSNREEAKRLAGRVQDFTSQIEGFNKGLQKRGEANSDGMLSEALTGFLT